MIACLQLLMDCEVECPKIHLLKAESRLHTVGHPYLPYQLMGQYLLMYLVVNRNRFGHIFELVK